VLPTPATTLILPAVPCWIDDEVPNVIDPELPEDPSPLLITSAPLTPFTLLNVATEKLPDVMALPDANETPPLKSFLDAPADISTREDPVPVDVPPTIETLPPPTALESPVLTTIAPEGSSAIDVFTDTAPLISLKDVAV